jgi:hypothetical protein
MESNTLILLCQRKKNRFAMWSLFSIIVKELIKFLQGLNNSRVDFNHVNKVLQILVAGSINENKLLITLVFPLECILPKTTKLTTVRTHPLTPFL